MTSLFDEFSESFVEDDTATAAVAVAPVAKVAAARPDVPEKTALPAMAEAALPVPATMAAPPNAGKTTTEAAAAPIAKAEAFKAFLVHCLAELPVGVFFFTSGSASFSDPSESF